MQAEIDPFSLPASTQHMLIWTFKKELLQEQPPFRKRNIKANHKMTRTEEAVETRKDAIHISKVPKSPNKKNTIKAFEEPKGHLLKSTTRKYDGKEKEEIEHKETKKEDIQHISSNNKMKYGENIPNMEKEEMTEFEKVAAIARPVCSRSSSDHYAGKNKRKLRTSNKTHSPVATMPSTCSGVPTNSPSAVTPLLSSSSSLTIGDRNFHIAKEVTAEDVSYHFIAVDTSKTYKNVSGKKIIEQNQGKEVRENKELEIMEKETQDEEKELLIKITMNTPCNPDKEETNTAPKTCWIGPPLTHEKKCA